MRKFRVIGILILILSLMFTSIVSGADLNKIEVDKSLKLQKSVYEGILTTTNGVSIYTNEQISKIDTLGHKAILIQEQLRKQSEGSMKNYLDITYPLVSEIEHYGIKTGYTESFYTDSFYNKKDNEEYKDIKVAYDFFKDISIEDFQLAIELIDFLPMDSIQVMFNPYKLFSSYAYCEDYRLKDTNSRRTRIYFIPNEGEDIISTFYHELGHMVYNEMVLNNPEQYKKYYDIYRADFDKYNAKDNYGRWDEKLTENFAEDFKIYVSHRLVNDLTKDTEFLNPHIEKSPKSFYGKNTKYALKDAQINKFFNDLLPCYAKSGIKTTNFRPNISLFLDDYSSSFDYRDTTYTNQYINKISTSSKQAIVFLSGFENSELKLKEVNVKELDKDRGIVKSSKKVKETSVNMVEVKLESSLKVNIGSSRLDYEIEIVLESEDKKYEEIVTYYLFKNN